MWGEGRHPSLPILLASLPHPGEKWEGASELLVRVAFSGLSISGLLQACSPLVRSAVEMPLLPPHVSVAAQTLPHLHEAVPGVLTCTP